MSQIPVQQVISQNRCIDRMIAMFGDEIGSVVNSSLIFLKPLGSRVERTDVNERSVQKVSGELTVDQEDSAFAARERIHLIAALMKGLPDPVCPINGSGEVGQIQLTPRQKEDIAWQQFLDRWQEASLLADWFDEMARFEIEYLRQMTNQIN